jgi:uncharacterized protein
MSLHKKILFLSALCISAFGLIVPVSSISSPSSRSEERERIEAKIHRLASDPRRDQAVVLLTDPLEQRAMPIWIGPFEANALSSEMSGISHPRPQTHDLFAIVLQKTGLKFLRVVITHTERNIYHASIWIEKEGAIIEIDSRPSDALVMALKSKAPIFISERLFLDKSFPLEKQETEEELWYQGPGQSI